MAYITLNIHTIIKVPSKGLYTLSHDFSLHLSHLTIVYKSFVVVSNDKLQINIFIVDAKGLTKNYIIEK